MSAYRDDASVVESVAPSAWGEVIADGLTFTNADQHCRFSSMYQPLNVRTGAFTFTVRNITPWSADQAKWSVIIKTTVARKFNLRVGDMIDPVFKMDVTQRGRYLMSITFPDEYIGRRVAACWALAKDVPDLNISEVVYNGKKCSDRGIVARFKSGISALLVYDYVFQFGNLDSVRVQETSPDRWEAYIYFQTAEAGLSITTTDHTKTTVPTLRSLRVALLPQVVAIRTKLERGGYTLFPEDRSKDMYGALHFLTPKLAEDAMRDPTIGWRVDGVETRGLRRGRPYKDLFKYMAPEQLLPPPDAVLPAPVPTPANVPQPALAPIFLFSDPPPPFIFGQIMAPPRNGGLPIPPVPFAPRFNFGHLNLPPVLFGQAPPVPPSEGRSESVVSGATRREAVPSGLSAGVQPPVQAQAAVVAQSSQTGATPIQIHITLSMADLPQPISARGPPEIRAAVINGISAAAGEANGNGKRTRSEEEEDEGAAGPSRRVKDFRPIRGLP